MGKKTKKNVWFSRTDLRTKSWFRRLRRSLYWAIVTTGKNPEPEKKSFITRTLDMQWKENIARSGKGSLKSSKPRPPTQSCWTSQRNHGRRRLQRSDEVPGGHSTTNQFHDRRMVWQSGGDQRRTRLAKERSNTYVVGRSDRESHFGEPQARPHAGFHSRERRQSNHIEGSQTGPLQNQSCKCTHETGNRKAK